MKEKIKQALSERKYLTFQGDGMTPAAVLVPIFCRNNENHILLTKRTHTVRHHKGQISFPGGVQDNSKESLVDTAKRETFEEVGVRPEHIEILGRLDQIHTITNYRVTPFVGIIPYPYPFEINRVEVKEIIKVPVSFLLDPGNLAFGRLPNDDESLQTEYYLYDNHVIWGATARIIRILLSTLGEDLEKVETCVV